MTESILSLRAGIALLATLWACGGCATATGSAPNPRDARREGPPPSIVPSLQSPHHVVVSRFELPASEVQHLVRDVFASAGVLMPSYAPDDTFFVATPVVIDGRVVTYRARLSTASSKGVWLLFLDGYYQYPGDSTRVSLQPSPIHISPRAWDKLTRVAKELYARRKECTDCGRSTASPAIGDVRYVNPAHNWSISYPAGWAIDTQNLAFVRLRPSGGLAPALVGIHAARATMRTPDELIDVILDAQRRSGQPVRVLSRQMTQLDGKPAVNLETELGSGTVGRSRRVAAVVDGIAYVIDAETYSDKWAEFAPHVDRLVRSFRVNR